eukprot:Hpha_TRINITY_DN15999_c1_g6::TRINITY_DN15999_c1_g6_i1::g.71266::m.71266
MLGWCLVATVLAASGGDAVVGGSPGPLGVVPPPWWPGPHVSPTPPASRLLKKYTIDLDQAPESRWVQPALDHKKYLMVMVDALREIFLSAKNYNITTELLDATKVPDEYRREMQGMADALGLKYRDQGSKKKTLREVFFLHTS